MDCITSKNLTYDSNIYTDHLSHVNQIYKPNMDRLKGKTAKCSVPVVWVELNYVLTSTLSLYHKLTSSVNTMFANKITFITMISPNIRY